MKKVKAFLASGAELIPRYFAVSECKHYFGLRHTLQLSLCNNSIDLSASLESQL